MKYIDKIIKENIDRFLKEEIRGENDILNDPEFKKWFSHGGLTDENGQPLLVYHGSGKKF